MDPISDLSDAEDSDEEIPLEDSDDEERDSHVQVNITRDTRKVVDEIEKIKPHRETGRTLQLQVGNNHGLFEATQKELLIEVAIALPMLEHIDITSGDTDCQWPVHLFTSLLLHRQGRCIVSIRLSRMKLMGSFRHFQDWAKSIRQLSNLERFSLDKVDLGKLPGTPVPATNEGCWLGPVIDGLASLPRLQHVRILGSTDFGHMSRPVNEGGQEDQGPVVKSATWRNLCKSTMLRSLCLIHFNLSDDNVKQMADQLKTNSSLKELDIDCTLGKESSRALESLLEQNTSLEDLNLCVRTPEEMDDNLDMTDAEMEKFLAAEDEINLPLVRGVGKSKLHNFALFRGHLSPICQDAFRTMMIEQCTLHSLTLYCGDDAINEALKSDPIISFYCKLNVYGRRRLLLDQPPHEDLSLPINPHSVFAPELSLVDTMGRVSNDVSCLFYLLSIKPSICIRAIQKMEQDQHGKTKRRRSSSMTPLCKRTRLYRAVKYTGVHYAE